MAKEELSMGSMTDTDIAMEVARVHYEAFEWSGCDGSNWHRLPTEARQRLIGEADDWRASVQSAGFSIIPTEALQHVQSAMENLDRARLT